MPTYNYKCEKCNKLYEVFHGMMDEAAHLCPVCQTEMQMKIHIGEAPPVLYKVPGYTQYKGRNGS